VLFIYKRTIIKEKSEANQLETKGQRWESEGKRRVACREGRRGGALALRKPEGSSL